MSRLTCRECRKEFVGDRAFRSHRIKMKGSTAENPKFRCMDDKEFAGGGFTQLFGGYYVGGNAEVWF